MAGERSVAGRQAFLSYRSADRNFVRRLAGDLTRAGIGTWLDERELDAGDDIGEIESAIRACHCLVVVLTPAAAKSSWVWREVGLARSLGKKVFPVMLQEVSGLRIDGLSSAAYADFRQPGNYRRAVQKLIASIDPAVQPGAFLSAKQAVAAIRSDKHPSGDLFGVSQQGVALLYSLANMRDWEFADAPDGTSRLWIAEFFDRNTGCVQPYAMMDGVVHDLPEHYLLGTDPVQLPDSTIVYSCALNHGPRISEGQAASVIAEHPDSFQRVSRRYSRFRPLPLAREFVDSTVAVSAALESLSVSGAMRGRPDDLFVLAKLERDKRNRGLPTWVVALFDPTLTESVLAVGVDAETGAIRSPQMQAESLNAAFFTADVDKETGNIVLSMANQFRAIANHVWDIPEDGLYGPPGLTASQAFSMVFAQLTAAGETQNWQVGYISNTGVTRTVTAPGLSGPEEGLMKPDGTAGQWVFELLGMKWELVSDGSRQGHAYPFRQLVCTAEGVTDISNIDRLICTSPMDRSPIPRDLIDGFERARTFAVKVVGPGFRLMSAALSRYPPEACWDFRFYDSHEIAAKVVVSADGYRLIKSRTPGQASGLARRSSSEGRVDGQAVGRQRLASARRPRQARWGYEPVLGARHTCLAVP